MTTGNTFQGLKNATTCAFTTQDSHVEKSDAKLFFPFTFSFGLLI